MYSSAPACSKEYTVTHGISQTDTETLSADLGVDAGGLSAELTAKFEHSVTASDESSEQKLDTVGSPPDEQVRVWLRW